MKIRKRFAKYLVATLCVVVAGVVLLLTSTNSVTIDGGGFLSMGAKVLLAAGDPEVGEVTELRTEHSVTHYLGDNEYALGSKVGSVNYYDGDSWEPIDNTLTAASSPWDWQMTKDAYTTRFLSDFDYGQILQFESQGQSVAFQPMALEWTNDLSQTQQISMPQNVMASVTNPEYDVFPEFDMTNNRGTITWEDAYGSGRNFEWRNTPGRLAKLLNLEGAPPAPEQYIIAGGNPVLRLNFIFDPSSGLDIYVDGSLWDEESKKQTVNYIEFRSGSTVLWGFAPAKYWDSGDGYGVAVTELRKVGGSLYVSVLTPYSWLQSATYPVFIDPTVDVDVAAGGDDGYVDVSTSSIDTSSTSLRVGLGLTQTYHAFYRFDGITIAQSSYVMNAYLTVVGSYFSGSYYNYFTKIYADDQNDPAAPTTYADYMGRTTTTASVDWDGFFGLSSHTSPNLSTVVQELVNSYDYSNEAIQILHYEDGSYNNTRQHHYTYETGGASIPNLYIFYYSGDYDLESPTSNTGSAWTNPTYAYDDGGSGYASIDSGNPSGSNVWEDYGFTYTTENITGVYVIYHAWSEVFGSAYALPTGNTANGWSSPTYAYDNDSDTKATYDTASKTWSPFLEFSISSIPCNEIRVWVSSELGQMTIIDVDAYYDGAYQHVYEDTVTPDQYVDYEIGSVEDVTAMRIRCYNGHNTQSREMYINEVKFHRDDSSTAPQIKIDVTWDTGSSWSSVDTTTLTMSEDTYVFDVTSETTWTASKLSDANFGVRALAQTTSGVIEVRLDWLPVLVTWEEGGGDPDISNTPSTWSIGVVNTSSTYWSSGSEPSWPLTDGDAYFTVTNNGDTCSITIVCTNFTGGVGWALGTPGSNTVRLTAFKEGDGSGDGITLTTSPQAFISALSTNIDWELKFESATAHTDGEGKTATVTLTATLD